MRSVLGDLYAVFLEDFPKLGIQSLTVLDRFVHGLLGVFPILVVGIILRETEMRLAAFRIDIESFIQHLDSFRKLPLLEKRVSQIGVGQNVDRVFLERFAIILDCFIELAIGGANVRGAKIGRREIRIVMDRHLEAAQRHFVVALFETLPAEIDRILREMLQVTFGMRTGFAPNRKDKSQGNQDSQR
jgi:hypothetical protein